MEAENKPQLKIGVIVGLDLIGDGLIKLPFLRALRAAFPEARIIWLTTQGRTVFKSALADITQPYLDEVLEQPAWLVEPTAIATAPYFDIVIDTRGRWRWAWQARRLPHKIFIAPAARYIFSSRRPRQWWRKAAHMQDRLLQCVSLAAGKTPIVHNRLVVPAAETAIATTLLPRGKTYIGFAPGAGNTIKIWPLASVLHVAQQQVAQHRVPVFLLGPQESGWQAEIQAAIPTALFPLSPELWGGKVTPIATMAIGQCLQLAVTNDSGTSHMLAAVDCPLVSLFGPTSAQKLAPRVSHNRIVTAQQFGHDSMTAIPVQAVMSAVEELFQELG